MHFRIVVFVFVVLVSVFVVPVVVLVAFVFAVFALVALVFVDCVVALAVKTISRRLQDDATITTTRPNIHHKCNTMIILNL